VAPRFGADGDYEDAIHLNILSQHEADRSAAFRCL